MKSKKKRAVLSLVFGITVILFSLLISNKLTKSEFDSLNKTDQAMFQQLSQVYETYEAHSEKIWNDSFKLKDIPLVLTPVKKDKGVVHSYSYVVGVEKVEDSFFSQKIEMPKKLKLPSIYRVSAISPSVLKTWFPSNFLFSDIGKEHTTFFKYTAENVDEKPTNREFKYFLMHEAFHEYHQVPHWKNVNELSSSLYLEKRSQEQYQLLTLEMMILDKVNEAKEREKMLDYLTDYVLVREARYRKYSEMKEEKKIETLEGTAQYVEYQYSNLVGDDMKPPFTVEGKTRRFAEVFSEKTLKAFSENGGLASFLDKDVYYYIGSFEGVILDQLEVDWKKQVDQGELIYDVLKEQVPSQRAKSLEEVKKNYHYEGLANQAKIMVETFNK